MQTLTERTANELASREQAAHYEKLTRDEITLRATISRLESGDQSKAIEALRKMAELSAAIPPELVTRSAQFVSGGRILRDELHRLATDGIDTLTRREAERQAQLEKAKAQLALTLNELKKFE